MTAADQLLSIWKEWKELTEAEARGIQGSDWEALRQPQQRKTELQRFVDQLPAPLPNTGHGVPKVIEEIMEMEKANVAALERQLDVVSGELATIGKGQRTLGQVRESYVPKNAGVWSSYS